MRAERNIHLYFRSRGAHPWTLECRNGLAAGIFNRVTAEGRQPDRALSNEAKFRSNDMLERGGAPATGSDPVDSPMPRDDDDDDDDGDDADDADDDNDDDDDDDNDNGNGDNNVNDD